MHSLLVDGYNRNDADIDLTATPDQLVVDDILHHVRWLHVAKIQTGVPQSRILCIVLYGKVEVPLALDVPTLRFRKQECVLQIFKMSGCGEAPATHTAALPSQQTFSHSPKFLRFLTGNCTKPLDNLVRIEIVIKQTPTFGTGDEVDVQIAGIVVPAKLVYDERLADLSCAFDKETFLSMRLLPLKKLRNILQRKRPTLQHLLCRRVHGFTLALGHALGHTRLWRRG